MDMNASELERYLDIIDRQRPVSPSRPPMAMIDRAAQFSPFAALTGHGDAIRETARLTEERIELEEPAKAEINEKLRLIMQSISDRPQVKVTYFVQEEKKTGGEYVTVSGRVKSIDPVNGVMAFCSGKRIPLEEILELDGEFLG